MITEKFKVMVRHWFPSQDGMDYMDGEASGELHGTYADAKREVIWCQGDPHFAGESFWIKKVEVEA